MASLCQPSQSPHTLIALPIVFGDIHGFRITHLAHTVNGHAQCSRPALRHAVLCQPSCMLSLLGTEHHLGSVISARAGAVRRVLPSLMICAPSTPCTLEGQRRCCMQVRGGCRGAWGTGGRWGQQGEGPNPFRFGLLVLEGGEASMKGAGKSSHQENRALQKCKS